MGKCCIAMTLLLAAGCTTPFAQFPGNAPAPQPTASTSESDALSPVSSEEADALPANRVVRRVVQAVDPPSVARPQASLAIYQVSVPAGAVSRNDDFWKRVDENVVHPALHDLLDKNGLRVGCAPLADFEHFAQIIGQQVVDSRPATYVASGTKVVPLIMKQGVGEQLIYSFDARDEFSIRGYEDCDNILLLEFQAAPRKPGDVRIGLCPMVRSLRTRLQATSDVSATPFEYVSPEKYFDVGLRLDIPAESFLIVAPSPVAESRMSLGSVFLMRDGETQRQENILLILPQARPPRIDKPAEPPSK